MTQNSQEEKLPYRVLGEYKPEVFDKYIIEKDLIDIINKKTKLHRWGAEVRDPEYDQSITTDWHQDNGSTACKIVVWASDNPTELSVVEGRIIKYGWPCEEDITGKRYQPKPYEIILFDNRKFYHRRPPVPGRWFFRVFLFPKR